MSAVIELPAPSTLAPVPLTRGDGARAIAFDARRRDRPGHLSSPGARRWPRRCPTGRYAINLCEDRYRFLVAFCAAAVRGQTTLLPPSRAPAVIDQVRGAVSRQLLPRRRRAARWRRRNCLRSCRDALPRARRRAVADRRRRAGRDRLHLRQHRPAAPNAKTWAQLPHQHRAEPGRARRTCSAGRRDAARRRHGAAAAHVRHGDVGAAAAARRRSRCIRARPFFPADVARALHDAPTPPLLVTTPVHLRALVESRRARCRRWPASSRPPRRCRRPSSPRQRKRASAAKCAKCSVRPKPA